MRKVAYICEPQVGGTFVFFTQLRAHLFRHGIDFRCIPPFDRALYRTSSYWNVDGVDFIDLARDLPTALRQLLSHLQDQDYQAVLTLPGCNELGTVLPAYLPAHIGCAAKIPHNGRGTYLPTQEMEAYIDRIAPVNHLLAEDLTDRYGIPPDKIQVVYIGIDPGHFEFAERPHDPGTPCRMIVVGRLEDLQKNILSLPDIVAATRKHGVDVHCTVVGHGPDEDSLKKRIAARRLQSCFSVLGARPYDEIPALLQQADIFLMPTRFEGCPHALLEAMATGCVPVVSDLRGTLDRIVTDGESGRLIPLGDIHAFGNAIADLARAPDQCRRMSQAARQTVLEKFTVEKMAQAYAGLLTQAALHPAASPAPRSLEDFSPPRSVGPTWRQWIPMPLKKMIRTLYARMGKSI